MAPPLLLLHGLFSNSYFWSRVAALEERRTVIAIDQPAHGASSAPEAGYSAPELADLLDGEVRCFVE